MYCSSEPDSGRLVTTRHSGTLATVGAGPFTTQAISLAPLAITDRRMEYCLQLAARNMTPYLQQRRQRFDETRWRNFAPQADFFLIVCQPTDHAMSAEQTAGVLSVRDEPDCPNALHIGDIQLEASLRRRGIGTDALTHAARLARSLGRSELTLHVFRENPAFHLYARQGFEHIATDVINGRYTMCRTLPPPAPA